MPTVSAGGPLPGARDQPPAPALESNLAFETVAPPARDLAEATVDSPVPTALADPVALGTPEILDAVAPPEQLEAWTMDMFQHEATLEVGSQTRHGTAHPVPDETVLAAGQAEVAGADLFDEPSEEDPRWPGLLPPTFFHGPPPERAEPRNNENADALRDLFIDAYAYDSQPSGEVLDPQFIVPSAPAPLPDRTTPIFGMPSITPPRPLRATRPSGGYRPRTSGGTSMRRITPVLSRAITPISTPVIPLHPGISYAPAMSPTPASVPALADYQSSRAVVHALEMVASQIRIGHLVVVGDVPDGDDVASLAAGVAAALAALLGVRE